MRNQTFALLLLGACTSLDVEGTIRSTVTTGDPIADFEAELDRYVAGESGALTPNELMDRMVHIGYFPERPPGPAEEPIDMSCMVDDPDWEPYFYFVCDQTRDPGVLKRSWHEIFDGWRMGTDLVMLEPPEPTTTSTTTTASMSTTTTTTTTTWTGPVAAKAERQAYDLETGRVCGMQTMFACSSLSAYTFDNWFQTLSPAICGNNIVELPEACDGGPDCSSSCQLVSPGLDLPALCGTTCDVGVHRPEGCGDGTEETWEACDDGNALDGDGCSANCRREASIDIAVTGEGPDSVLYIDGNEQCRGPCTWSGEVGTRFAIWVSYAAFVSSGDPSMRCHPTSLDGQVCFGTLSRNIALTVAAPIVFDEPDLERPDEQPEPQPEPVPMPPTPVW